MTRSPARVAMLSSVHPPFDIRIFQKEARTLAAAGYDVKLVVPHDRDEVVDGVQVLAFPRPRTRLLRIVASAPRMFRTARALKADVYHFHDPELIPLGLALKLLGRTVIYDAHEDLPKSILDKPYLPPLIRGVLAAVVGGFEKTASRAFDLVIVAAESIGRSFHGHHRVLVIHNYPVRQVFAGPDPDEGSNGDFIVAYAGALSIGRGAIEMIHAVRRLPAELRPILMILGRYSPESLLEQVRELPGYERVAYRGWVPYEVVARELRRAQAGLVCFLPRPNHIEAGPNKLFEYMAAGLPVVASNFDQWREIVEGNDCGICVDPTDPTAIASALEYLARHPERRAQMGANGRRAVLERYTWESEGRRMVEAYRALRIPE